MVNMERTYGFYFLGAQTGIEHQNQNYQVVQLRLPSCASFENVDDKLNNGPIPSCASFSTCATCDLGSPSCASCDFGAARCASCDSGIPSCASHVFLNLVLDKF